MKTPAPGYPFQPLPKQQRPKCQGLVRKAALHYLRARDMRRRGETDHPRYAWHIGRAQYIVGWTEGSLFYGPAHVRVDLDEEVDALVRAYPEISS